MAPATRWQKVRAKCNAQPVSRVRWIDRSELSANDYNPNHVARPELLLLEHSILVDGWTQPIVILPDLTIVDGFHRWTVAGWPKLRDRYGGYVPVAEVDADPLHRMMTTIRHNRARGTHGVLPMAEIVRIMDAAGVAHEAIQTGLGMEDEEITRLLDRAGTPDNAGTGFGSAWEPDQG